jgi:hypothetical protein
MVLFKLKTPLRLLICAPSNSGKSFLIGEMIQRREEVFDKKIDKVLYFSKFSTSIPPQIRNDPIVQFCPGLPTEDLLKNPDNLHILIVLDDLLETVFDSPIVSQIFTQGKNRQLSVCLLAQNLFPRGSKFARNISLNCSYLILFRNNRDSSSVMHLGKQTEPGNSRAFSDMCSINTSGKYQYILCDFDSSTQNIFKYRGNLFDRFPEVYLNENELEKYGAKRPITPGEEASVSIISDK